MNVTIPTLAPLEDILVEEITEHERGCEARHHMRDICGPCSRVGVALYLTSCDPTPKIICETAVAVTRIGIDERHECTCGAPVADCWSVVMLP